MSDHDIVSLDEFRQKKTVATEAKAEVTELHFLVTPSSIERLDDLQRRLNALSYGQVIAAAVDILDSCLKRIEDGKKIAAIDPESNSDDLIQDPRFSESPKPKPPA